MKVALVNPPPRNELDKHWAPFPVLGLAYVAASLRAAGHQVRVLDGKLGELSVDEIHREIVRDPPDLVGITCMTVEFPATARIAQQSAARCRPCRLFSAARTSTRSARWCWRSVRTRTTPASVRGSISSVSSRPPSSASSPSTASPAWRSAERGGSYRPQRATITTTMTASPSRPGTCSRSASRSRC